MKLYRTGFPIRGVAHALGGVGLRVTHRLRSLRIPYVPIRLQIVHTLYSKRLCFVNNTQYLYTAAVFLISVAMCLAFYFVEWVEGMGHGDSFGEWSFASMFQQLVLIDCKCPV